MIPGFGYYETICGGAGAGDGWAGQSGVHCHMTNTAIGDAEVIERRYPVIVHEFSVREGSGGAGKWSGGCGITRDFEVSHLYAPTMKRNTTLTFQTIQFRKAIDAAILSERRVIAPYGMKGGQPGQRGRNIWRRKMEDGSYQSINVGGKAEFTVSVGDHFILRQFSFFETRSSDTK